MTATVAVRSIHVHVERRTGAPPTRRARFGIWLWVAIIGSGTAYEVFAFLDGKDGEPTISQLVKRMERAGGIAATLGVALALFGAFVGLELHWVLRIF